MDFEELKQYKPNIPFRVIEKDLSLVPALRRKTFFSEEDMSIGHSKERLSKGEVEIPVFKDSTIRPLGFKGKLLSYELESLGAGFYAIHHKRGKIKPKWNDRQHPNEEIDRKKGGIFTFYIAYDRQSGTYKYLESEKTFQTMYQEIAKLKNGEDVQELINDFIDWIQSFWTFKFKHSNNFGTVTSKQRYSDYLNIIEMLEEKMPMIKSYHLLLNIFGDICDTTYAYITGSLKTLETHMKNAKDHIHYHFPDPNQHVDHHKDELHGKPLLDFIHYMQARIIERGYFVDRDERKAYRNIAEVFHGEQFATSFESDSSKRERIHELLQKVLDRSTSTFFKV